MSRTAVSSIFHPLALTLSILFVAGAAFGVGSAAPKGDGIDNRVLAEIVAKESFKEFGRSPEGTVLARFRDRDNPEPLGIWVYCKEHCAMRDPRSSIRQPGTTAHSGRPIPFSSRRSPRERTSSALRSP